MPPCKIEFKKSAQKEFDRLPKNIQDKVVEALQILSLNPFSEFLKIKKLHGTDNLYRLRVGDYRIAYTIQKQTLTLIVIKIGDRKDIYRFLK